MFNARLEGECEHFQMEDKIFPTSRLYPYFMVLLRIVLFKVTLHFCINTHSTTHLRRKQCPSVLTYGSLFAMAGIANAP